ncbi:MAG: hypothetical protein ACXAEU_15325 [Candidatus Hodarchaeales archaeon]|jgi:hypothetical protein
MINYYRFLILALVSFSLMSGDIHIGSVSISDGMSISTHLVVWSDRPHYLEDQDVKMEVSIWDEDGQVVEIGELHVIDLNGSTRVQASVNNHVTLVSWVAIAEGLEGVHEFEITYNDPSGQYLTSSTILKLLIAKQALSGELGMTVELDSTILNVAKGQVANLEGNLNSVNTGFPYFYIDKDTAYILIEANIEGTWRIMNVSYPTTGITISYGFELAFTLPTWVSTGPINARCVFSGSITADLAATTVDFTINLLPLEKSLILLPQQATIERNNLTEQHVLPIEVQVPGFDSDPVTLDLVLLAVNGSSVKKMLVNHVITSYISEIILNFTRDIEVGSYNLSASLFDQMTGSILAVTSASIDVTDDLMVDNFYWDVTNQQVLPGQEIQGYLVSREEDTFSAVKANLLVEVRDTGLELFNDSTGDNGYVQFTFTLPEDFSPSYHDIDFKLSPLPDDRYHRVAIKTIRIVTQQKTSILHQQSQSLTRSEEGWFNATVIDEQGLPVEEGSLSLRMNGDLIHESNDPLANFVFTLPANAPRGTSLFTWYYSGSSTYRESEQSFPVTIYSVPAFSNLTINTIEAFPGDDIEIFGQLLEETGEEIVGAEITVTHRDNWDNFNHYSVLTGDEGQFAFNYKLDNESNGVHHFMVEFKGWTEEYYLLIDGKLFFEINAFPKISLILNDQLIAGENASLEFHGRPDQEMTLEILDEANWLELATFTLDAAGKNRFEWFVPDKLRGEVLLRASYNTGTGVVIFNLRVKVRPLLDVQLDKSLVLTNEEILFLISCSENHDIWLDGDLWQENLTPGTRQYSLSFSEAGDHELKIIARGNDVLDTTKTVSFQVRKDYSITVNMPTRAQRSMDFVVSISVVNSEKLPLEGFILELMINNTLMATTKTSQAGTAEMTISLNTGYYEGTLKVLPLDTSVYLSKVIVLDAFTIYSVPVIEIPEMQPVNGRITSVEIKITDGLNPLVNETINVHLKGNSGNKSSFIDSNRTDNQGIAMITWNVTQESGNYLFQVINVGNEFLESIISTTAITVLSNGPQILLASIVVQDSDNNLFLVSAVVDFPGGKGKVQFCSGDNRTQVAGLQEVGDFWTLQVELTKGQHVLWIQAVDAAGIESWYSLGTVNVLKEVPSSSKSEYLTDGTTLSATVRDTLLSAIFLVPFGVIIVYKKRKTLIKS